MKKKVKTNCYHLAGLDLLKYTLKKLLTEYYNLAMSREFTKLEDGDVWLSFPSSERNKVDEETFLILKKATDT